MRVAATVTAIALLAAVSVDAQSLIISRGGSRLVRPAPAETFTGGAQVETSPYSTSSVSVARAGASFCCSGADGRPVPCAAAGD